MSVLRNKAEYDALIKFKNEVPFTLESWSPIDDRLLHLRLLCSNTSCIDYGDIVLLNHPESYVINERGLAALTEYEEEHPEDFNMLLMMLRYSESHPILSFMIGFTVAVIAGVVGNIIFSRIF